MNKNLKKVISSIAAFALSLSCFSAFAADFSDVAADYAYKNAIDELVALEIVNGYEDGTFKPEAEITRAEVTKMVVAAMGPSYTTAAESSSSSSDFTDVNGHWATGYINVGVAQKFINGMGDGTFSPDTNVTYAQIVKMLVAALGYTTAAEGAGGYPNGYLQIASQVGVTAGVAGLDADTAVTRGQVAQLIANAVKTPIVAITSWTTDIYGKPVAQTEVMDGQGDSGKYQTLLTEYHDTYSVKGRVTATHAQGTVETGKVAFDVEYADNFDGEKIAAGKNKANYSNLATPVEAYFGDTAAEDLLFTYADALIKKDADDEYHIVSIYAYGRNEIVSFSTDNYDAHDFVSAQKTIDLTTGTSSKAKTYKLDDNVAIYVNGILYTAGNDTAIATYVAGNKIGGLTLIDTPAVGSTSKDGKYDYIMIDYAEWAVVDTTSTSASTSKVFFEDFQATGNLAATLNVDLSADTEKVYTYVKDGVEVGFDAITDGSVLLISYDVTGGLNDSTFVKVDISENVLSGQITSRQLDANNMPLYTIEGANYSYVDDNANAYTFNVGDSYDFALDSKGRIISYEEGDTFKNYGIIDRVNVDSADDVTRVRIINTDGTRVSYTIKNTTTDINAAGTIAYSNYDPAETDGPKGSTLNNYENRVVSYKLNSKNQAYDFVQIPMTFVASAEYKASSSKLGNVKVNDSTKVVDLSAAYNDASINWNNTSSYSASDIAAGSIDSFADGDDYGIWYGDKSSSGYAKIVLITRGQASVGVNARFAVVESAKTGLVEEDQRTTFELYTSTGEIESLFVDEDHDTAALLNYKRGDIIVYSLSSAGEMKNITKIFSPSAVSTNDLVISYADAQSVWTPYTATVIPGISNNMFINSGVTSWDASTDASNNGYARVGFGAILARSGNNVTLGKISTAAANVMIDTNNDQVDDTQIVAAGDKVSTGADIEEFSLASDVNIYVYDFNERDRVGSNRVTVGATGSIQKTFVPDTQLNQDNNGNDVYNWSTITSVTDANYAYFKVVDDEITDIMVIVPYEA